MRYPGGTPSILLMSNSVAISANAPSQLKVSRFYFRPYSETSGRCGKFETRLRVCGREKPRHLAFLRLSAEARAICLIQLASKSHDDA
jgi:hypothetical protein